MPRPVAAIRPGCGMTAPLDALNRLLDGRALAVLFALCFTPLVLFIGLLAPPGETPDEPTQIARAGSLLSGQLLGRQSIDTTRIGTPFVDSGVVANMGPTMVCFGIQALYKTGHMTAAIHGRLAAIPWDDKAGFISAPNVAPYFPVFYAPMAVGLGIGRVLGYTPLDAVIAARVASGLAFVALGTLALLVARYARIVLFATLTLPMTLWLGATCNQDGVMIAAVCLAAALLTAARSPTDRWFLGAGVLLACFIAVKPPYIPLAAAMLLPLDLRDRAIRRRALLALVLVALPAIVWTPIAQHYAAGVFIRGPSYTAGPLWPGPADTVFISPKASAQLAVFKADPTRLITIPVRTFFYELKWKVTEMLGVLAALTVLLPAGYYEFLWYGLVAAVATACIARASPIPHQARWKSGLVLLAIVAALFLVYDAQYLSWTFVGADMVQGMQGRYYLPFIPFLGLGMAQLALPTRLRPLRLLALPVVAIALFGVAYIPTLIVTWFYL